MSLLSTLLGNVVSSSSPQTFTGTTQINILKIGASGTVGAFNVYPSTASRGSLRLLAANNVGDTVTTIANAPQAAARVYTLPDAGADANLVMSEGDQTINGVKSFGSIPIGTAQAMTLSLSLITALGGAAKIIAIPSFAGTITKAYASIDGAITISNITVTLRVNTNNITNGLITIANVGSGFGTSGNCTPTAANTFVAGDVLNCIITGGIGTVGGAITLYITRTA